MNDSLRVFSTTNNHNNNCLVVWNIFFHNIWDNPSHWLIFFTGVETANQICYNHLLFGGHGNAGRLNPHQICLDGARDFFEGIVDNIGIMWDNGGGGGGDDDDDDDDRKDMGLSKNGVIPGVHRDTPNMAIYQWGKVIFNHGIWGILGVSYFQTNPTFGMSLPSQVKLFFNTWSMKKIPWPI